MGRGDGLRGHRISALAGRPGYSVLFFFVTN
jgi:hypothetical protein